MKSSIIASGWVRSRISLMSAPAAKALSLPVITMAPIALSASKASKLLAEFPHQRVAQRVQRRGPVEADQPDPAMGFDDDVFVGRHEARLLNGVGPAPDNTVLA